MITLALDTSTARGSVAVLEAGNVLAARGFEREPGRDQLFVALQDACRAAAVASHAVELVVVGLGPGSFTGIRAGIAAAVGLALPQGLPVKGVPSFDAIAIGALPRLPLDCELLAVLADARRGEIYHALYDRAGTCQQPCRIGALAGLVDAVHDPIWFVGAEIDRFREELRAALGGFANVDTAPAYPDAAILGRLGWQQFLAAGRRGDARLDPLYLRATDYQRTA